MNDDLRHDSGSVKVHEQVIAELVYMTLESLENVKPLKKNLVDQTLEAFGQKVFPGIDVHINENQETTIDVKVLILYGKNIPAVAREVQEALRDALQKTIELNIKKIDVNVHGIERGAK